MLNYKTKKLVRDSTSRQLVSCLGVLSSQGGNLAYNDWTPYRSPPKKFLIQTIAAVSLDFTLSKYCSAFLIHVPRIPLLKSF
jgi:hypothetical protein